jgi:molybdopterin converting factor small subunit
VITIRYWAAAKAAAGVAEDYFAVTTLAEARDAAVRVRGKRLAAVLTRSSFLVDGVRADADAALRDGAVVEVLPPFAGG